MGNNKVEFFLNVVCHSGDFMVAQNPHTGFKIWESCQPAPWVGLSVLPTCLTLVWLQLLLPHGEPVLMLWAVSYLCLYGLSAELSPLSWFLMLYLCGIRPVLFYPHSSFFIIHLFTCAYIVCVIFPSCPPPTPCSSHHPSLPGRTCSALISNFVEEKT
jgi:hypothetical protein